METNGVVYVGMFENAEYDGEGNSFSWETLLLIDYYDIRCVA